MYNNISAKGYTSVVMVLNMKRFVTKESQRNFETIRCTQEFADVLRKDWYQVRDQQDVFLSREKYTQCQQNEEYSPDDIMTPEQVGYATGIFRGLMLEKYTFPTYMLNKEKVAFDKDLRSNFQFTSIFKPAWDRWNIYIRPSHTGFFTIRLTYKYQKHARSISHIAKDVLRLQESLDVPSALNWLEYNRKRYADDPQTLSKKRESVNALLRWVGAQENDGELLYFPVNYFPVNWKVAMEAAGKFVRHVGKEIKIPGTGTIHLAEPTPDLSLPLHDSYVIYHFEKMFAHPSLVGRADETNNRNAKVEVDLNDIRESVYLKETLANLVEGSILRGKDSNECKFPKPRWSITDSLLEKNQASWNDELCLLMTRVAINYPSQTWPEHELVVSTTPGSTMRVNYSRYWSALERLIEFTLEIRVLSQLVESTTYDLLGEMVNAVQKIRSAMFKGDIKFTNGLPDLIKRASHIRRQAALAQSLSNVQLWSRAEFAIHKANHLLNQLGVPKTQEHINSTIASTNSVVDHIDEWYLADLTEKNNDRTTLMSLGVAGISLTLTLLALPSFWADLWHLEDYLTKEFISTFSVIGTSLALLPILFAFFLLIFIFTKRKDLIALLRRINEKRQ